MPRRERSQERVEGYPHRRTWRLRSTTPINPGKAASHMSPAAARVLVRSRHAAGDSAVVRRASSAAIAEAVFTNSMVGAASRSSVIELMPRFYPTGSGFTLHGRTLVRVSLGI